MSGLTVRLLQASAPSPFAWRFDLESASAVLTVILLEVAYLGAINWMHQRNPGATPVSRRKVIVYTLGVVSIFLVIGTPVDTLSDQYLLSAHMLQHLVLMFVAAPLMLWGLHDWTIRPVLLHRNVRPVAYFLTRPVIAFAVFNLALLFVHLPGAINVELHSDGIHFLSHVVLVVAGLIMWWPVLGSLPELPRPSPPIQLIYLFMQSWVPGVLSAFMIFTSTAFYSFYVTAPRIWGISPIDDQRIGGVIMKLGGTAILWGFMTVVFFKWFNDEERKEPSIPPPPPDLQWEDVAEELERMGLTKR